MYSLVSRAVNVLAEYQLDGASGNFATIARVLLRKVEAGAGEEKRSFQHDQHAFHYLQHDGLVYLVMADKATKPSRVFSFLEVVRDRFTAQYGARAHTAVAFAFQADFSRTLKAEMERFNATASDDRFHAIRDSLSDVKEQMHDNLEQVIARGERIDLLVDKSEDLDAHAIKFHKESRGLRRFMCTKNVKWTALAVLLILMIVLFLVLAFCGVNFSKCKA